MKHDGDIYLSIEEAAAYFDETTEVIQDWIEKRLLPAAPQNGAYAVLKSDAEHLWNENRKAADETDRLMRDILGEEYSEEWGF